MGKGSSSSGPDIIAGAEVDRQSARESLYANRPDQYNPFGSINWLQTKGIDPATNEEVTKWTQQFNLSPESQAAFDSEMGLMQGRLELAGGMLDRITNEVAPPPDWAQFGDVYGMDYLPDELRQRAEDAAYQRSVNRLNPRFDEQARNLEIKLRNQGLRPGDQAYDSVMGTFGRERNDAFEQARLGAVDTGRTEAQQLFNQQMQTTELANALRDKQIEEYIAKRGFSLNEAERLGGGQSLGDLVNTYSGG